MSDSLQQYQILSHLGLESQCLFEVFSDDPIMTAAPERVIKPECRRDTQTLELWRVRQSGTTARARMKRLHRGFSDAREPTHPAW